MFRSSDHDPLAVAIAPPKNESPAARAARLRAEAEARRVSDEIDEQLKQDRVARRRQRPCVKVLLLGQSESGAFPAFSYLATSPLICLTPCLGKSTTLKSECHPPPPRPRFSVWACWLQRSNFRWLVIAAGASYDFGRFHCTITLRH